MICTALTVAVVLNIKTVTIECMEGHKVTRSAVVGKAATPTPRGRFKVYYVDDESGYGSNRQYAAFKKHGDGSEYAIHGNDRKLDQSGSLGCVRFDQAGVRINVGTTVVVR